MFLTYWVLVMREIGRLEITDEDELKEYVFDILGLSFPLLKVDCYRFCNGEDVYDEYLTVENFLCHAHRFLVDGDEKIKNKGEKYKKYRIESQICHGDEVEVVFSFVNKEDDKRYYFKMTGYDSSYYGGYFYDRLYHIVLLNTKKVS